MAINTPLPVTVGQIRLVAVHGIPGRETMIVTTGPTDEAEGIVNLAEAQAMVADGAARWARRDASRGPRASARAAG
jgi:hypothetical protein